MSIKRMWAKELDETFDVEQFAAEVLENAMENLESDGFLQSAAFIVFSDRLDCYLVAFSGYDEKEESYSDLVCVAREGHAAAIVTLNDAYMGEKYDPETYVWGQAAKNPKGECIFVTISGPGRENWTKEVEYKRENGGIVFGKPVTERKEFLGMLNDWSKDGQRVN